MGLEYKVTPGVQDAVEKAKQGVLDGYARETYEKMLAAGADFHWIPRDPWYKRALYHLLIFLRIKKPKEVGFYFAKFELFELPNPRDSYLLMHESRLPKAPKVLDELE